MTNEERQEQESTHEVFDWGVDDLEKFRPIEISTRESVKRELESVGMDPAKLQKVLDAAAAIHEDESLSMEEAARRLTELTGVLHLVQTAEDRYTWIEAVGPHNIGQHYNLVGGDIPWETWSKNCLTDGPCAKIIHKENSE